MISKLPEEILEYLINELPPFTGVLIIKSDNEGSIIDYMGPHHEYLVNEPVSGKHIHEFVPALYGMIPPLVSPMVLNKIHLKNSVYVDIHIYESSENEFWIFFVDQSHQVAELRDFLQKLNEKKFNKEATRELVTSNPYDVFGDLIMEIESEDKAILRSKIPEWFTDLAPGILTNSSIIYTDIFPFLEVFNIEANEFWNKNNDGHFRSGIWSETIPNKGDLALTATAILTNGDKYILIRPHEKEAGREQIGFQMAREQKLAYEKLEKAEAKLKTLLEYKDKFVSIVSHDLRSPVAAVLGISDMLINDKDELNKLNDFYQEMIYNIKEELEKLLDYNNKLYHWSNLELGNFEIVKNSSSLKDIIESAQRTSHTKFEQKNIIFTSNLKTDIIIDVDISLISQVINNLVSNAIKFTPIGGTIAIDVYEFDDHYDIAVNDSGVGMPEEVSSNIFSGFARNSTMGTSGEKGTGLGLGIVKKIIDAHGFTIRVESKVGEGSRFIISIPLEK